MRALSRFAPPLVLMAVIFFFSAQPDLGTGLGAWDTILRKAAHMAEYGLLWFLWYRALEVESPLPAALITIVEGRHGTPVDVLIDAAGIAIAIAIHSRRRTRTRE
jgi:hypothetical protein